MINLLNGPRPLTQKGPKQLSFWDKLKLAYHTFSNANAMKHKTVLGFEFKLDGQPNFEFFYDLHTKVRFYVHAVNEDGIETREPQLILFTPPSRHHHAARCLRDSLTFAEGATQT